MSLGCELLHLPLQISSPAALLLGLMGGLLLGSLHGQDPALILLLFDLYMTASLYFLWLFCWLGQ